MPLNIYFEDKTKKVGEFIFCFNSFIYLCKKIKRHESESQETMDEMQRIYNAIAHDGFADTTLQIINDYVNDILYGRKNLSRFNISEHAGLCTAGEVLIGASIVASYATASLTTSGNTACGQEGGPANWEIDAQQETLIEEWAKASRLWVEDSEEILTRKFGPKIAQGAEAKVYYREGDTSVVKERTSIYSTTQKALDAIALHNYLFPETAMHVVGFTRDSDHLMRMVLTQPYVRCLRLATKEEIDQMVEAKGFHDNWNGQGVNYISDRLALEDMHPANVFIDEVTERPICIDCVVKFIKKV
ncbi:MAG: hypothetical protein IKN44_01395 [Bacteroidaceae bacterium]|nr:hypothetical protein [Bacteroidaceae bacterium]